MVDIDLRDSENKTKKDKTIKAENIFENESRIKCDYGCNNPAKYKISNGKLCCSKYPIQCLAVRYKNQQIPDPEDYVLEIQCDCLYKFTVRKSEARNVCPHCGRSGTFIRVRRHIEWK